MDRLRLQRHQPAAKQHPSAEPLRPPLPAATSDAATLSSQNVGHDFGAIDIVHPEQRPSTAVQRGTHYVLQPSEPRFERAADHQAARIATGTAVQRCSAAEPVRRTGAEPRTGQGSRLVVQRSSVEMDGTDRETGPQQAFDNAVALALLQHALQEIAAVEPVVDSLLAATLLAARQDDRQALAVLVFHWRQLLGTGPIADDLLQTVLEHVLRVAQQPREEEGGEGMDIDVQRVATASGTFDHHAPRTQAGAVGNTALATLTFGNVTAQNTSTYAHTFDLKRQPRGTGVGQTRPSGWARFIAMIGGNNIFVQGHSLNQWLGGDGTHDNLSPFTRSLNGMHYNRAEWYVYEQTDENADDEYADYDVDINYGSNDDVGDFATDEFDTMSMTAAAAAMRAAGIVTAAQAALIKKKASLSAAEETAAHNWLTSYVDDTFPESIDCSATFIDDAGGGNYTATAQQQINITNEI